MFEKFLELMKAFLNHAIKVLSMICFIKISWRATIFRPKSIVSCFVKSMFWCFLLRWRGMSKSKANIEILMARTKSLSLRVEKVGQSHALLDSFSGGRAGSKHFWEIAALFENQTPKWLRSQREYQPRRPYIFPNVTANFHKNFVIRKS